LAPVVTEVLFDLGLGDRVVGVTRFCDRPPAAARLPKVGGYVDPSLEAIARLKPDLVIAMPSRGQRATLDALRALGVPVLVVFGDSLREVRALILALGRATQKQDRAEKIVATFDHDLAHSRRGLKSPIRTLVLVGVDPLVAAGPGTFVDEILVHLGAAPVLRRDAAAWPVLSLESVVALDPQVVIVTQGGDATTSLRQSGFLELAKARGIAVVQPPRTILQRPGPQLPSDAQMLLRVIDEAHPKGGAP
jgi:iron complex transport system substrate-binding protein